MSESITGVMSVTAFSHDAVMASDDVMSLDSLVMQALAKGVVTSDAEKSHGLNKIQDPQTTSDPAQLFELQQRTAEYNLKMSLFATLTRKAIGAVETVVRA